MADVKIAYGNSFQLTFTSLNSLAASAGFLGGGESEAVDNTTNKYDDYLIGGYIKAGAANAQVGLIEVYAVAMLNDTEWPDVFDGTDSAETISAAAVKTQVCQPVAIITTAATNDAVYPFGPVSVKSLFGGSLPKKFVCFVTHTAHTTTNQLAASGSAVFATGVYGTVS